MMNIDGVAFGCISRFLLLPRIASPEAWGNRQWRHLPHLFTTSGCVCDLVTHEQKQEIAYLALFLADSVRNPFLLSFLHRSPNLVLVPVLAFYCAPKGFFHPTVMIILSYLTTAEEGPCRIHSRFQEHFCIACIQLILQEVLIIMLCFLF